MRKLIYIFSFLFTFGFAASSVAQPVTPELKEGLKVSYAVNYFGTKYNFIVTLKELGKRKVVYEYQMDATGTMTGGKVTMKQTAIDSAVKTDNFFQPGENKSLDEMTSGFVSRKVYETLTKGKEIKMENTNAKKKFKAAPVPEGQEIKIGDKVIDALYAVSEDGKEKFWILKNPEFPMVLKMDLGWTISITTIE